MAVTQTDIDNLNAAIATGEKQVVLDGHSITYRSISDLIAARNDLQEQLNRQAAQVSQSRRVKRFQLYYTGRGYN
jgi:hypothetical protein